MFKNLQAALSKLREGQHVTPQPAFNINQKVETKTSATPLTKQKQTFQDEFEVMEADQDLLDLLDEIEEQQSQQSQLKVPEDVLEIENDSTTVGSLPTPKFLRTGHSTKPKEHTSFNTSVTGLSSNTKSILSASKTSYSKDQPPTFTKSSQPNISENNNCTTSVPSLSPTPNSQAPSQSRSKKLQEFLYKKHKNSQNIPSKNTTNNDASILTKNRQVSSNLNTAVKPRKNIGELASAQSHPNDVSTTQPQTQSVNELSQLSTDLSNKHKSVDSKTPAKPKSNFLATLNAKRTHTPMNQTLSQSVSEPRHSIRANSTASASHIDRKNYSTGKIRSRVRRLPGPAGDILALGSFDSKVKPAHQDTSGTSLLGSPKTPTRNRHSAFQEDDFISGAWSKMLTTLNLPKYTPATAPFVKNTSPFLSYNIQYILEHGFQKKIPYVILMIKETRSNEINVGVTFVDPTGEISGTIHRKVVEMYPDDITTGTVLVLQQVSVFSPSLHSHYLNVTPQNIVHLFPSTREEVLSPTITQSGCQSSDLPVSPLKERSSISSTNSLFSPPEPGEQQNLAESSIRSRTATNSHVDIPLFLKRKSSEMVETSSMLDEPKLPEPKRQLFTDRLFSKNPQFSDKSVESMPMPSTDVMESSRKMNSVSNGERSSPVASQPLFSNSQPVVEEDLECLLDGIEESFFEDDLI